MYKTLFLGIDVAMAENTYCPLLDDGSETRPRFSLPNNLPGAKQLVKEILVLLCRLLELQNLHIIPTGY